jgi:hypothetical protein
MPCRCIRWRRVRSSFVRSVLILITLILSPVGAVGGSHKPSISELPDGTLSGNTYVNDAVGLKFEIPRGWIATADPKGPVNLDSKDPDGPVNRCSKILLSIKTANKAQSKFRSTQVIFAVDPRCFPGEKFPRSIDRDKVMKFGGYIGKAFLNTPFISKHYGFDVGADPLEKQPIVSLTGSDDIDAGEGNDDATLTELTHVNRLLAVAESNVNPLWVVWGGVTDDAAKEELQHTNIQFWLPDRPHR